MILKKVLGAEEALGWIRSWFLPTFKLGLFWHNRLKSVLSDGPQQVKNKAACSEYQFRQRMIMDNLQKQTPTM